MVKKMPEVELIKFQFSNFLYNKRRVVLYYSPFFFLLLNCQALKAQHLIDSLKHYLTYTPTIDIGIDSRNSFISGYPAQVAGIKLGLDFNKKIRLGIGANYIYSNIPNSKAIKIDTTFNIVQSYLNVNYFSFYGDYVFMNTNKWEIVTHVTFGTGVSYYKTENTFRRRTRTLSHFILLYEPLMEANYKIIKYAGVGVGLGYRIVLLGSKHIDERFTSALYVVKVNIYFSEIWNDIRKRLNE
jgi:hypothetical protein